MTRFNNGYVKVYRTTAESDLMDNMALWALWNWLLVSATWKTTTIKWRGQRRILPPGSVVFGIKGLADRWHTSQPTVKRWLSYLVRSERIMLETVEQGSLVTIRKWNIYQNHEAAQLERPLNDRGLIEEGKKERRKKTNTARPEVRAVYAPEFESLWEHYGRIGKKADASKAFADLNLSPEEMALLRTAVTHYLLDCGENQRKQMYLGTFLRDDWRDWLTPKFKSDFNVVPIQFPEVSA